MAMGLVAAVGPHQKEPTPPLSSPRPVAQVTRVKTPDGFSLAAYEWGNPSGPEILFVHGAYQSALAFRRQFQSDLAKTYRMVAFDLLGHGGSEKPYSPAPYREGEHWANELHAVMDAFRLRKPTLVAWSFGGRVVGDYLAQYGDARLRAIVFAAATTKTGPGLFHPNIDKLDEEAMSEELPSLLRGTRAFLLACVHRPWAPPDLEDAVAYNMMAPPYVRRNIAGRKADYQAVLARVGVPVLAVHGDKDQLILPAMSEYTVKTVQRGRLSLYRDVGHSPFYEDAQRFNRELAELAKGE